MMTDTWTWATVTQASPLRIKVDGDTSALDATTDDLVGSLAVSDRVRVHLHSDGIIVTGLQGGGDPIIPVGGGITWWGASDPASPGGGIEYAIPDGRALSRSTYSALYALWGTTFGADNSWTFNMPNSKGRVQVGRDSGDWEFNSMGETRGAKTHAHTLEDGWALIRMNDGESTAGYQSKLMPTSYRYQTKFTLDNARVDSFNSSLAIQLGGSTDADSSVQPSIVANTAIRIK